MTLEERLREIGDDNNLDYAMGDVALALRQAARLGEERMREECIKKLCWYCAHNIPCKDGKHEVQVFREDRTVIRYCDAEKIRAIYDH